MKYVPNQGDIIVMNFDPQTGFEQQDRRPALVVSNSTYNIHSKMAIVCPITDIDKNHAFHIPLNNTTTTTGVVLCDQVRVIDVATRNAVFAEHVSDDILKEVIDLVCSSLE